METKQKRTRKPLTVRGISTFPSHRTNDRDTSIAATEGESKKIWGGQRVRVFNIHKALGLDDGTNGLTDYELMLASDIVRTGVTKRRLELGREGLIKDSGRRRPTDTKKSAIVWTITEAGMEATEKFVRSIKVSNDVSDFTGHRRGTKTIEKLCGQFEAAFLDKPNEYCLGVFDALMWVLGKAGKPKL